MSNKCDIFPFDEYQDNSVELDSLMKEIDILYKEQTQLEDKIKNICKNSESNISQSRIYQYSISHKKEDLFIYYMFRAIIFYFPELKQNSNIIIALWLTLYFYILLKMIQKNTYIR